MKKIGSDLQTLYLNLVQRVHARSERPGSVYTNVIKGRKYLYAKYQIGRSRTGKAIGPADDAQACQRADLIRQHQQLAKDDATTISVLKSKGIPAPTTDLGYILDALSYGKLFDYAVLVGTAAYQCYSPIVGYALPSASLMTQDADIATATLAADTPPDGETLLDILRFADSTFRPIPALTPHGPSSAFTSASGFQVDLITQQGTRDDVNPLAMNNLDAGAVPLQHIRWLIDDPVEAVALHGTGVAVRIPQPARYAVHKLIIAQKRKPSDRLKRLKDLDQAQSLISALSDTDPHGLAAAWQGSNAQGKKGWREPALRSLQEIGLSIEI